MARRGKRWRRRAARVAKRVVMAVVALSFLMGLSAGMAQGQPFLALAYGPAAALGALIALPFVVLALTITLLGVALPFGILAAIFGGPVYLIHRLIGAGPRHAPSARGDDDDLEPDDEEDDEVLHPARAEARLRRRYVAGELSYEQFQSGMLSSLKQRFSAGQLSMTEYERELDQLLHPSRVIEGRREPAVAIPMARPRR